MAKIQEPEKEDTESSSGEYETGSSSEEDSEPETPQPQPTKSVSKAPKSVDVAPKSNTVAKKPVPEPTPSATPVKRRPTEEDPKDGKKKKVELQENTPGVSKSSKNSFARVWSDGDEIVILQGILDYAEAKNSTPSSNIDGFLEFIKKNLQYDGNKNQLRDKISKLKKRYKNNKTKYEENKLKGHDLKSFELCHNIWGNGAVLEAKMNVSEGKKSTKKNRSVKNDPVENKVNVVNDTGDNVVNVVNVDADLFAVANGNGGSKKMTKLLIEELELSLKVMDVEQAQLDLRQEHAKLKLDSMKSKLNL